MEDDAEIKIWILYLEHHSGTDIAAFSTQEKAQAALIDYVDRWWDRASDEEKPADAAERVALYFRNVDETVAIRQLILDSMNDRGRA
jgi:hypothetical protein